MLRDRTAVGSRLDRAEVIWLANYLSPLNRHSVIVVLYLVWLYIAKESTSSQNAILLSVDLFVTWFIVESSNHGTHNKVTILKLLR